MSLLVRDLTKQYLVMPFNNISFQLSRIDISSTLGTLCVVPFREYSCYEHRYYDVLFTHILMLSGIHQPRGYSQ